MRDSRMESDGRIQRDQLLRAAILAGDERAWQVWYDATFDDLCYYVHWRCGGLRDRTDDVVQETWLTAVRRVQRFDPRQGSFRAWLRGIAANVLRNHLRRQKTIDGRQRPLDTDPPVEGPDEAARESRQRAERIMAALDALPERHEAVLRAKYLEGQSVTEIADAWGQTPKAVESLLSRARQKFRDTYQRFQQNGRVE